MNRVSPICQQNQYSHQWWQRQRMEVLFKGERERERFWSSWGRECQWGKEKNLKLTEIGLLMSSIQQMYWNCSFVSYLGKIIKVFIGTLAITFGLNWIYKLLLPRRPMWKWMWFYREVINRVLSSFGLVFLWKGTSLEGFDVIPFSMKRFPRYEFVPHAYDTVKILKEQ